MKLTDAQIAHFLERLKWETSAALGCWKNLEPHQTLDVAKLHLEAIQSVLVQIDRANDAVPIH